MARRGVDVSDHTSTALTPDLVRQADHVFAMTRMHRGRIVEMMPSAEDRVVLLVEGEDVHDPIGGTEEEYELCAQTIEDGLRARLREVVL